ncbi:hypothetical protein V8F06_000055 [Rhypophila decipiens]
MEGTQRRPGDPIYRANLERTVRELQKAKDEAEAELKQLRATTAAAGASNTNLSRQVGLEIATRAYRDVAESDPFLPFNGSVLPALIALRNTNQASIQTNEYISLTETASQKANARMESLRAELKDQQALRGALERRVETLKDELINRMETSPEQVAQEKIEQLKEKKAHYDKETTRLLKMLNWFIKEHLGPMLAAEELGGPVVGALMEIGSEDLSAGFSAQGKLKKTKAKPDEDTRQRRIDDIWGARGGQQDQAGKRKRDQDDEASAAAVEMRNLTEQLLNKLTESGGDSSSAYVQIARETAAARFLVRSKVAVFHPRDATRIRLVDFGREIED